jgi:hypothetical protein
MSVDQKIFVDGHIGKLQLRKLVKDPDGFDDDTVEMIWEHLDECEACVTEYEAILVDNAPDDNPPAPGSSTAPGAAGDGALEPDLLDPEDFNAAKVETPAKRDDGMNGVTPVEDNRSPNGAPIEYKNGDRPAAVAVQSDLPSEAANEEPSEGKNTGEGGDNTDEAKDDEKDNKRPVIEVEKIEGLITGEVHEMEVKPSKLETESAVDAAERIAKRELDEEEPHLDSETDAGEESPQEPETDGKEAEIDIDDSSPDDEAAVEDEDPFIAPAVERKPAPLPARPAPAAPTKAPAVEKKSEPLEDVFNKALAFLVRPRNALIIGGTIVMIAAAVIAAIVTTGKEKERLIAGWEPLNVIETRVPLQEVIVRKMRRGRIAPASGPDVTLDFRGIDRLVIAVDLDFIKGKTSPHDVIVRNPAGLNVYQEPIPQLYLDDGRFFLRLVPDQFEEGATYKMELVTYRSDESTVVVAESVFDVLK